MTRRVVVTGAGVVTALGYELADFWERICAGKSGVGTLKRFETTDFKVTFGGQLVGALSALTHRLLALLIRPFFCDDGQECRCPKIWYTTVDRGSKQLFGRCIGAFPPLLFGAL